MNYEQKYKEAKRLYETANADQKYVLESLFPELRETEEERIRKELITHCRNTKCVTEEGAERIVKWIAWLEKQGEQKPDFEPTFKVGDWVVKQNGKSFWNGDCVAQITNITDYDKHWLNIDCWVKAGDIRLWTIEDAKEGDVIAALDDSISIFKGINPYRPILFESYCELYENKLATGLDFYVKGCHPATKEQRDLLFQKIKEAGYVWDAEKKEVKKIEVSNKESEDEQIRKELIEQIAYIIPNDHEVDSEGNALSTYQKRIDKYRAWLEKQREPEDKGEISDGFHTFNELYRYRMLYNAAFFNLLPKEWAHKSKRHHDGEECFGGGWFIVMANLPTGQISNHYELKDWDLFDIPEKDVADEWDGHTTQDAAERLYKFLSEKQGGKKMVNAEDVLEWLKPYNVIVGDTTEQYRKKFNV